MKVVKEGLAIIFGPVLYLIKIMDLERLMKFLNKYPYYLYIVATFITLGFVYFAYLY